MNPIGPIRAPGQRPTREQRDQGKRKVPGSTLKTSTKPKPGRTATGRYLDAERMVALIEAVGKRDGFVCIGTRLGYKHDCHGEMQALHCVDQKQMGVGHPGLDDPDLCVYGCGLLNAWLDNWRGPLVNVRERVRLRAYLGERFEAAVYRHGLQVEADRKFEGAGG